jgi:hypothetical protein
MTGAGEYVCGLEPSTHEMRPTRQQLRDEDLVREIAPGQTVELRLEVGAWPEGAPTA